MIKRIILLLLCMCVVLSFAACTTQNTNETENGQVNGDVNDNKPEEPNNDSDVEEMPDGFNVLSLSNEFGHNSEVKLISNANFDVEMYVSQDNRNLILIMKNMSGRDISRLHIEAKYFDEDGDSIFGNAGFAVNGSKNGFKCAGLLELPFDSTESQLYVPEKIVITIDAWSDELSTLPMHDKISARIGGVDSERSLLRVYLINSSEDDVDNIACVALFMKDGNPVALEYAEDTYIDANAENDVVFSLPCIVDNEGNESFIEYDSVEIIYNSAYAEK